MIQIYKFGNCYLNVECRQVIKNGQPVVLTPKTFDVLLFLIENHGRVISKDELLGAVWNGQFVEESNLAVHISKLRALLSSGKTDPLIETVPGCGYRFVAHIQPADPEEWDNNSPPTYKISQNDPAEPAYSDSIAVLPLQNEDNDEEIEYLADGLTENFINNLAYIPKLKVIARNSVFRYKDKKYDIKEVGETLDVSKVLTGRIKIIKDHVTLSVELINTADNTQIWGFQYSQPFSDIIKIQEEITAAVSEKLRTGISQFINRKNHNPVTEHTESYRLYLKGKYFLNNPTEQSIYKAITCFEKSIAYDPLNVYSYVEMIESYRLLYVYDYILYTEAQKKIKPLLTIISNLNQSIAEVQSILGAIKEVFEWDFKEAEKYYINALALNSNCVSVRYRYLVLLTNLERFSEALEQANKLISLDPLSPNSYRHLGRIFYRMQQFSNALNYLQELLDLEPDDYISLAILGAVLTELGKYDEALEILNRSLEIQFNLDVLSFIGYTYALSNNPNKARQIIKQIEYDFKLKHHISFKLAIIYLGLGEIDTVFNLLEKALEEHDIDLAAIKSDPRMKLLYKEPKFQEIIKKIGLC
jgi:TolB-like protein